MYTLRQWYFIFSNRMRLVVLHMIIVIQFILFLDNSYLSVWYSITTYISKNPFFFITIIFFILAMMIFTEWLKNDYSIKNFNFSQTVTMTEEEEQKASQLRNSFWSRLFRQGGYKQRLKYEESGGRIGGFRFLAFFILALLISFTLITVFSIDLIFTYYKPSIINFIYGGKKSGINDNINANEFYRFYGNNSSLDIELFTMTFIFYPFWILLIFILISFLYYIIFLMCYVDWYYKFFNFALEFIVLLINLFSISFIIRINFELNLKLKLIINAKRSIMEERLKRMSRFFNENFECHDFSNDLNSLTIDDYLNNVYFFISDSLYYLSIISIIFILFLYMYFLSLKQGAHRYTSLAIFNNKLNGVIGFCLIIIVFILFSYVFYYQTSWLVYLITLFKLYNNIFTFFALFLNVKFIIPYIYWY